MLSLMAWSLDERARETTASQSNWWPSWRADRASRLNLDFDRRRHPPGDGATLWIWIDQNRLRYNGAKATC